MMKVVVIKSMSHFSFLDNEVHDEIKFVILYSSSQLNNKNPMASEAHVNMVSFVSYAV